MAWRQRTSIGCTLPFVVALSQPGTAAAGEADAEALAEQARNEADAREADAKALAEQARSEADAKAFAEQRNKDIADILEDLALEDAVPRYTDELPPEANYYSTDANAAANLDRAGRRRAATDPQGQYIQQAHVGRPHFPVDPSTDAAVRRAKDVEQAADALAENPTGACRALPTDTDAPATSTTETCDVIGTQRDLYPSCTVSLDVQCEYGSYRGDGCTIDWLVDAASISADAPWSYQDGTLTVGVPGDSWHASSCTMYYRSLTVDFHGQPLEKLQLVSARYEDWIAIYYNSEPLYLGPGYPMNTLEVDRNDIIYYRGPQGQTRRHPCAVAADWGELGLGLNLLSHTQPERNTLEMQVAVSGRGDASLRIDILGPLSETSTRECAGGFNPRGRLPEYRTCSDSTQRYLDGHPLPSRCWRWLHMYHVVEPPEYVESEACAELRQRGCSQIAAECAERADVGYCARQVSTFACRENGTQSADVELCAEVLACPDGDCAAEYQETHDATADFQRAASALSVTMETARGLDPDTLGVFVGQSKSCHNAALGYASCCAASGWGIDTRLTRCTTQELELGIARQEQRAHYVGRYASGIWGTTTRKVYCVYPSKLARIVVEQGKAQLAAGYGSPRQPDCSGFTREQLESLDFDAMDLAELHADVLATAQSGTVPDPKQLAEELRTKITRMGAR